jgi:hypothetical protein
VAILLGRLIRSILKRIAGKKHLQDKPVPAATIGAVSKSMTFVLITIGYITGIQFLRENVELFSILSTASEILIVIAIGYILYHLLDVPTVWFTVRMEKADKQMNKMFIPVITKSLRAVLIILVLIQII